MGMGRGGVGAAGILPVAVEWGGIASDPLSLPPAREPGRCSGLSWAP